MLASHDCLPTPLFPSRRNPFLVDLSDSNSASDAEDTLSRDGSLNELPGLSDNIFLGASPINCPQAHKSSDFTLGNSKFSFILEEDEEAKHWEEIYERADEFLDQEGIDIVSPSPILNTTRARPTILSTFSASILGKSEQSTAADGDSPFSDCQSFSGPTFWARRTISGGLNKTALGLLTSNIKSEPLVDFESPENVKQTRKGKIYNFKSEMKAFHAREVASSGKGVF